MTIHKTFYPHGIFGRYKIFNYLKDVAARYIALILFLAKLLYLLPAECYIPEISFRAAIFLRCNSECFKQFAVRAAQLLAENYKPHRFTVLIFIPPKPSRNGQREIIYHFKPEKFVGFYV